MRDCTNTAPGIHANCTHGKLNILNTHKKDALETGHFSITWQRVNFANKTRANAHARERALTESA